MVAPAVEGIDLFKIAGRSISGWVPSLKTGTTVRQPFCSQLEERLMLWLEYHPLVASYARGDIGQAFASAYRLPTPKHAPFAIGYTFEGQPHDYLPDIVGRLTSGKLFIAEAGMEDDKRGDRNLAKAEAARHLARLQRGVFWIGTERTLTRFRHYNLVFLHARRQSFPAFADIAAALQEVWPWGEMAPVCEVASRLEHQFPAPLVEAAIWKVVADSAAQGRLLVDLEQFSLDRTLPLALLPTDASPRVPDPLPDTLLPEPTQEVATIGGAPLGFIPGPTFDGSTLPEPQREQFHRNLRAVGLVLAGATQTSVAEKEGIAFDSGAASEADEAARTNRLCPSWQLSKGHDRASCLPGVHSSVVSAPHAPLNGCHPGTYRDAPSGGAPVEGVRDARSSSLLQTGAHRGQSPEDGAGSGGCARKGQIRSS